MNGAVNPWNYAQSFAELQNCFQFPTETVFSIWELFSPSNVSWDFLGCKWQELNLTIWTTPSILTTRWRYPEMPRGQLESGLWHLRAVPDAFCMSAAYLQPPASANSSWKAFYLAAAGIKPQGETLIDPGGVDGDLGQPPLEQSLCLSHL